MTHSCVIVADAGLSTASPCCPRVPCGTAKVSSRSFFGLKTRRYTPGIMAWSDFVFLIAAAASNAFDYGYDFRGRAILNSSRDSFQNPQNFIGVQNFRIFEIQRLETLECSSIKISSSCR